MNPIYEYIAAILILSVVVGYSLYQLNTMSSSQLSIASEEQLQPVAGRLLDKILLTEGNPTDWGSNISINKFNLVDFGISSQLVDMYRIDADKLMRLVEVVNTTINPLYIPPTTMGALTGIYPNDSWSYGFRLLVKTALNISITNSTPANFTIDVTNYFGRYAENAQVNAIYVLIYTPFGTNGVFNYTIASASNVTNWQGETVLNFANKPSVPTGVKNYTYILFVTANYYGLQSHQIKVIGGPMQTFPLLIQGQYLITNYMNFQSVANSTYHNNSTAIEFTSNLQVILDDVVNVTSGKAGNEVNSGGKNYSVYQLTHLPTEEVIFSGLIVKNTTGEWCLALCFRPQVPIAIDYRSQSSPSAGINAETFSRLVRIGRDSYYAELTLWRMAE
jgi:hypothetical protein